MPADLYWLPPAPPNWKQRLRSVAEPGSGEDAWREVIALSQFNLSFSATNALANALRTLTAPSTSERLAILSSSTTSHLHSSLRVSALRRGIPLEIYECDYGQYRQVLLDASSPLYAFRPTTILFCLDASHVCSNIDPRAPDGGADAFATGLRELWRVAQTRLGCEVLQQTIMNRLPDLLGNNEHRYAVSPATFTRAVNVRLRAYADATQVDLVALDHRVAHDGRAAWHNIPIWLKAKQESLALRRTALWRLGRSSARRAERPSGEMLRARSRQHFMERRHRRRRLGRDRRRAGKRARRGSPRAPGLRTVAPGAGHSPCGLLEERGLDRP